MSIYARLAIYIVAIVVVTGLMIWSTIAASQANLDKDPSSMAWVGFLPFLVPVFVIDAVLYVAPVAAVVEIGLGIWRWWK